MRAATERVAGRRTHAHRAVDCGRHADADERPEGLARARRDDQAERRRRDADEVERAARDAGGASVGDTDGRGRRRADEEDLSGVGA